MKKIIHRCRMVITAAIVAVLIAFLLVSCEQRGETVEKELNRVSLPVEIRVHTYKNDSEVSSAYNRMRQERSLDYNPQEVRLGWALWSPQDNRCDIHVVEPKYVNEKDTFHTWGHELAHCVYGRFHR